ncbi:MAG: hypothetical protein ACWA5T_02225 [Parvularcula sp.]
MNTDLSRSMAMNDVPEGFDPSDEPLPFLSNFQDVFLSMGVIILLVGVGIFGGLTVSNSGADERGLALITAAVCAGILVLVWFLSEVLVRKRRRILPGIVLSGVYLAMVLAVFGLLYGVLFGESLVEELEAIDFQQAFADVEATGEPTVAQVRAAVNGAAAALPATAKGFVLGIAGLAVVAAFAYYRRFRLPFASGLVGIAAIGAILTPTFLFAPFEFFQYSPSIQFLSGLALLFAGVSYDMKDPERLTRFSGNGFWLNLFAAPLILSGALTIAKIGPAINVDAIVAGDFDQFKNPFSVTQSVVTLMIIGVFAVISLLLNRRALVVSGLVSAGIAIGVIVKSTGVGAAGVAATTLVLLGALVLLLGIGWHGARRVLLAFVPSGGFFGRMFPRNEADG